MFNKGKRQDFAKNYGGADAAETCGSVSYTHLINMPMTAISDLRSLAKDDPFFNELADICDLSLIHICMNHTGRKENDHEI